MNACLLIRGRHRRIRRLLRYKNTLFLMWLHDDFLLLLQARVNLLRCIEA